MASTTIGPVLAQAINKWMEAKPSRNAGMLSRISGVSYSSIRRAMIGDSEPNEDTAFNLGSVVMTQDEFKDFLGVHWPVLKRYIVDSNFQPSEQLSNTLGLTGYIQSPPHLKVLILGSGRDGTSLDEVKARFGEAFEDVFDELCEARLLNLSSHGRYVFDQDFGSVSLQIARRILGTMAEVVEPRGGAPGSGTATAWIGWESFSPQAARKANRILAEANKELFELIRDKDNHGDVLVFMGLLLNIVKGQEKMT